ncbi:MAG TPA: HAD family hydrolase [Candidatus Didemnitutus sp.]|nr:HAD family hydrolase [Candidatus Didemnitutus sp.]
MKSVRLLFDLDGTLTDPFIGITASIQYALGEIGIAAPEAADLKWCIGPPLRESFAKMVGPERADQAVLKYRERFASIGLLENRVYPGIPEALRDLVAEGFQMHVVTSKPTVFAMRIIEHFELSPFFTTVQGSELDGTRAHKDVLIEHVLSTLRVDPIDAVMVGDRAHDMVGAGRNRVRGLGVLWGYGTEDELRSAGAFACAVVPGDIVTCVQDRP